MGLVLFPSLNGGGGSFCWAQGSQKSTGLARHLPKLSGPRAPVGFSSYSTLDDVSEKQGK